MQNFKLSDAYASSQFSDVNEAAWYGTQQQKVIKTAFDLGIMNGMGDGSFCPSGKLKVSEAVKMAAMVHSIYTGDKLSFDTFNIPWYKGYVDYAIAKGIITDGEFVNFDAYVTRSEMAQFSQRHCQLRCILLSMQLKDLRCLDEPVDLGIELC